MHHRDAVQFAQPAQWKMPTHAAEPMGPSGFSQKAVAARLSMNLYIDTYQLSSSRDEEPVLTSPTRFGTPCSPSDPVRGVQSAGAGGVAGVPRLREALAAKEKRQLTCTYQCVYWYARLFMLLLVAVRPSHVAERDPARISCLLLLVGISGACFALSHRFLHPGKRARASQHVRRPMLGGNPARREQVLSIFAIRMGRGVLLVFAASLSL